MQNQKHQGREGVRLQPQPSSLSQEVQESLRATRNVDTGCTRAMTLRSEKRGQMSQTALEEQALAGSSVQPPSSCPPPPR